MEPTPEQLQQVEAMLGRMKKVRDNVQSVLGDVDPSFLATWIEPIEALETVLVFCKAHSLKEKT